MNIGTALQGAIMQLTVCITKIQLVMIHFNRSGQTIKPSIECFMVCVAFFVSIGRESELLTTKYEWMKGFGKQQVRENTSFYLEHWCDTVQNHHNVIWHVLSACVCVMSADVCIHSHFQIKSRFYSLALPSFDAIVYY